MSQKLKSLLFLSCFILTAVIYYLLETNKASTPIETVVDTNEETIKPINQITISSFEDDDTEDTKSNHKQETSD